MNWPSLSSIYILSRHCRKYLWIDRNRIVPVQMGIHKRRTFHRHISDYSGRIACNNKLLDQDSNPKISRRSLHTWYSPCQLNCSVSHLILAFLSNETERRFYHARNIPWLSHWSYPQAECRSTIVEPWCKIRLDVRGFSVDWPRTEHNRGPWPFLGCLFQETILHTVRAMRY